MRIRRVTIERFRGLEKLQFQPGARTVILGPNNAGKSAVLEALDLLLHSGLGRPRPAPEEVDYFGRDPSQGFAIEAVLGDLPAAFRAEVHQHLEGWREATAELVPDPDGDAIEPVVRVRVRGTADFDVIHEFAKPESEGARFHPALRSQVGWVFDGRARDPMRQLSFYQGGLLDRLFADADLDPAIALLRDALSAGAAGMNKDSAVDGVLRDLAKDLEGLGLLNGGESVLFESGSVSRRALLQTLQLALPAADKVQIPLGRQGRGAQRLVLVAVLLRLAQATGRVPIAGFEEPEEALEPIRQAQLADMLGEIADRGGQVLAVTHSPEIVRSSGVEDLLLLQERSAGRGARHLRGVLPPAVRQAYERRLDGAVVRGMFARLPVLVEGPGDRAVFQVFWRELAKAGDVPYAHEAGLDVVNSEGVPNMPMLAAVLAQAGKAVLAWVDQDSASALKEIGRLRAEGNCAALLLHNASSGMQNLEEALASGCSLDALAMALESVAEDRGYSWDDQRTDLLSRCDGLDSDVRENAKSATSLLGFLTALEESDAHQLVAAAMGAKGVTPFEIKGARQGRIVASSLVAAHGVPDNFAQAFRNVGAWIRGGCSVGVEIEMPSGA